MNNKTRNVIQKDKERRERYSLVVSGEKADREKLAGSILVNSTNLHTAVRNIQSTTVFFFQYMSHARITLRNASRSLNVAFSCETGTQFGGARATFGRRL